MSGTETTARGKVLIFGAGGAGCSVIRRLKNSGLAEGFDTAVVDTDSSALEGHPADRCIAASSDWILKNGVGCGGDIIRGERALARERGTLTNLLRGYDLIVVTAGLGGGTATGGLRTIASVIRGLGIPSVFLVTLPFAFESFSRRRNAEACIDELLPLADILLTLPDDLLFSRLPPDCPAAEAFDMASAELAGTAAGIASVLRSRGLAGADFAVFMSALRGHRCACGIGTGTAEPGEGIDRAPLALERMLDSPFLGGLDYLKNSDSAIIVLSGGKDLSLAEMKRTMEQAASLLPPQAETLLGTAIEQGVAGQVRLTAIAIHYQDPEQSAGRRRTASHRTVRPAKAEKPEPRETTSGSAGPFVQGELGLTSFSRGVFERLPLVRYHEMDLDVPTFQRRDLNIDKGS